MLLKEHSVSYTLIKNQTQQQKNNKKRFKKHILTILDNKLYQQYTTTKTK